MWPESLPPRSRCRAGCSPSSTWAAGRASIRSSSTATTAWSARYSWSWAGPVAAASPTAPPQVHWVPLRRAASQLPFGGGLVSAYVTLVVLIPIAALVAQASGAWEQGAWRAVVNPQTLAALELTVGASALV